MARKYDGNRESWGAIRKLSSGRLQASYVKDGTRYTAPATFDTLGDARAWLRARHAEIAAGTWQSPDQLAAAAYQAAADHVRRARTLRDYATEWIDQRSSLRRGRSLAPRTRVEYLGYLRRDLAPLADRLLSDIKPEDVRAWRDKTVKRGKLTMAARTYTFLSSVMKTAVRDHIITENPCQVDGGALSRTGRKSDIPTAAEFGIMELNMPERFRAMIAVAGWAGLRFGEVTELRRHDISTDDDGVVWVSVTRGVTHPAGMGYIVGPPKSDAGIRDVPLHPTIGDLLLKHLAEHVDPEQDALLFPAVSGRHLAYSTFTKSWYPARAAAGREDMGWHTLRAYATTRFAMAGATQKEIQEFLGDSTMHAAAVYQRTTGRSAELVARMG